LCNLALQNKASSVLIGKSRILYLPEAIGCRKTAQARKNPEETVWGEKNNMDERETGVAQPSPAVL
jgi:hypothetical protein